MLTIVGVCPKVKVLVPVSVWLGMTRRWPLAPLYSRLVVVVVWVSVIIVPGPHMGSEAFCIAVTSIMPLTTPPPDSAQLLKTRVTPVRIIWPSFEQGGIPILGVTV